MLKLLQYCNYIIIVMQIKLMLLLLYRGIWCCIGVYRGIWCCIGVYRGIWCCIGVYRGIW